MGKPKQASRVKASPSPETRETRGRWPFWAAGIAFLVAFAAYAPALGGDFVWDDRFLPFFQPAQQIQPVASWVAGNRPLLMLSFWANYRLDGLHAGGYHAVNLILHWTTSVLIALVLARLLEWTGVRGERRAVLAVLGAGLFLLHPLQTESVSYVASRSETLSVCLFFAAYVVFLYRPPGPVRAARLLAIGALAAAALSTKEHTLMLPALLLLTDSFWNPRKLRENWLMYAGMSIAGAIGAVYVFRVLGASLSAGFNLDGLSPTAYFFTQCRVIWRYLRLVAWPAGQNIDTDFPVSQDLFDHGAIYGLIGLLALLTCAVVFRKRWPLASFGIIIFLLLIAPTSSVVPITDVVAERRLYLPFLGLVLVALEPLRRVTVAAAAGIGIVVLMLLFGVTTTRNQLWGSPVALWQDTVEKSPRKIRPRFQLGYAYYQLRQCQPAAEHFVAATRLGPPSQALMINLGLAFSCAGNHEDALLALAEAERINPDFDMPYFYRGQVYADMDDDENAAQEYERALARNPANAAASEALSRLEK